MAIVCGTDFSPNAATAVASAAAAAERLGEPLWLVHVLDPAAGTLNAATVKVIERAITERLEEEAGRLSHRVPGGVHVEIIKGLSHQALISFAESKGATLVVVASQGHGSSPLLRLGGTSERIAAASPLP